MAKIARIYSFDGDDLIIVPGTDPQQILATAAGEIDDNEVILTTVDEAKVEWWRTVPCSPNACDEGPHLIHYIPTRGQSRGGFQAAAVEIGYREEAR